MKNLLIALFGLLTLPTALLHAQSAVSVHTGATFSNVRVQGVGDFIPDAEYIARPFVSVMYETAIAEGLFFRTGMGFQQRGFLMDANYDLNVFNVDLPVGIIAIAEADYLTAPVNLKYQFPVNGTVQPYVFGGVTGSYATAARIQEKVRFLVDVNIGTQDINLNNSMFNRWEFGGQAGLGVDIELNRGALFFEGSYHTGFTNILNDPILDVRLYNQNYSLGAGYSWRF
jgi:opacity protein-like surface antigen